jgi:hypothetical protein
MFARNGASPAHRVDGGRARKVVGTGERDRQTSKPPKTRTQYASRRQISRGQPDTRPATQSPTAHLSGRRLGEENDDYPVVASLNARWRVIVCRQSIQWILQRRRGGVDHWRGYWFCRTREALIRGARKHVGDIAGDALVRLLRLPARFPEGAR